MLQNTVKNVTDLSHIKQLSNQVVTHGKPALGFEEYLELLLSACSTYDKNHVMACSGQCNVNCTTFEHDNFYDAQDGPV
jgi:hypothetical protein